MYRELKVKKILCKEIKFCRFGGLSPVVQKGYNVPKYNEFTYHSPPARRGFYAFVYPYIELFLLSNEMGQKKWGKSEKLDEYGDQKDILIVKPKIFKYTGELWHHLGKHCHHCDIIKEHHSWVKTSFEVYVEALRKEFHYMKLGGRESYMGKDNAPFVNCNNPTRYFTKDHLEVFIERIK